MIDYWVVVIVCFLVVDKSWHLTGLLATRLNSPNKVKQLIRERQDLHLKQQKLSAQDHYAQWTKNNRKLDTLDRDVEQAKKDYLEGIKSTKSKLAKLKFLLVTAPFTFLKFYKGKIHVSSVPKGMFPRVIEGTLEHGWLYVALAPIQSKQISEGAFVMVSLGIWLFALLKVLDACEFIIDVLRESNPEYASATLKDKNQDSDIVNYKDIMESLD
ncbi:GET complex subunit GET1 Ecym_6183 [Eremothecium cymbalariae DBVPG|uniref:Golgi to ER traffic protein 1 n=1 Tax=Eremothecium cymbalariae (strain CBS 270.75 / DBVPG 7215 / KCTC 17166 / NRRL Y-17582) TaxID=931890 RepID=G8JV87_ERECY|nr:hypothetical protein Ecym_6183 [Eremothecium cymbalariae DBVPG\